MYLYNPSDFTTHVAGLPGPGNPFIRTYRTENSERMFVSTMQFLPQMRMTRCSIYLKFLYVSLILKFANGTFPKPISFIDFSLRAKNEQRQRKYKRYRDLFGAFFSVRRKWQADRRTVFFCATEVSG